MKKYSNLLIILLLFLLVFSLILFLNLNKEKQNSICKEYSKIDDNYIERCLGKGGTIKEGRVDENGCEIPMYCTHPNALNESNLPSCEYNVNYATRDECVCSGIWSVYDNGSGISCVLGEREHFCRRIILNAVGTEVIVDFKQNTSFNEAKEIINKYGGIIRVYSCDFENQRYPNILAEVEEGTEADYILKIGKEDLVESANRNGLGSTN